MIPLTDPNCYGFPDAHFSPENYVHAPVTSLAVGSTAPSFALATVDGQKHSLSTIAASKKGTMVQFGSWT